jgi:hypothetical protein
MREVRFLVWIFENEKQQPESEAVLRLFLEALVAANVVYLKHHPNTPKLYQSGVRYEAEQRDCFTFPETCPTEEDFKGIPYLLHDGYGDCEDLACWRVAELLVEGHDVQPYFTWRLVGNTLLYHIMVRYADGRIEDPSKVLGMKG